jgi:hypothetical protein
VSGVELSRELRDRALALRDEIDGMLLELPDAEGAVPSALKTAAGAVSRFCELGLSDDGIASLDRVRDELVKAREALPADRVEADGAVLEEARSWAEDLRRRALDRLPSAAMLAERLARAEVANPFQASVGAPVVHVPFEIPAPEVIEKRRPFLEPPVDKGDGHPTEKPKPAPITVQLARLGRDAMEDVAILGGLRRLKDDDVWSQTREFEARLLANLDALWSLDRPVDPSSPRLGVPQALFAYVTEWSFPDWGRAFALSFSLGCVDSEAALRWVVLAMRRSDSAVMSAYVAGLAAASGSSIGKVALAELTGDVNADTAAAWLEVAEKKRVFEASAIVPLLTHPSAAVRIRAARCLRNAPRDLAISALHELADDADLVVRAEAADELAAVGRPEGAERLRLVLSETLGSTDAGAEPVAEESLDDASRAAVWVALAGLAIGGDPADEARVLAVSLRLRTGPEWLGWYGRPAHVEILLRELHAARELGPEGHARAEACERAIQRITGLGTNGSVAALRAEVATLVETSAGYREARRARHGKPFDVQAIPAELRDPQAKQGARRMLARELALHTPAAPRIDVDDWLSRQDSTLALL